MFKHKIRAALLSTLVLACAANAKPAMAAITETRTTVITACGRLFQIDANADGLTAEQRAAIVQSNLDKALIAAAADRSAAAVKVELINRNPTVSLAGHYIVTADGNSAARRNMTQLALAEEWADSIRRCLADSTAINNYLSMLTGRFPTAPKLVVTLSSQPEVAVAPWGTLLPIALSTPISSHTSRRGETVEATLTADVPLGPAYTAYLPAGTVALGALADAGASLPNRCAGRDALTLQFYALKLPDGKQIPISAHVLGGVNNWETMSVLPTKAICGKPDEPSPISYGNKALSPCAGEVAGAWRGLLVDQLTQSESKKFIIGKAADLRVTAGQPMLLELEATTSIGLNGSTMTVATQGPGTL